MPHFLVLTLVLGPWMESQAGNNPALVERGGMPVRVHVAEDYETEIEQQWWLRRRPETESTPASRSRGWPNRRACRATGTADFDRQVGAAAQRYKAVVFNPVPGPSMGPRTRPSFRYRLQGTDTLRVQIFSLTNNDHRRLDLGALPQGEWRLATVDLTQARRPNGSGGRLEEDERIDDIQFYVAPDAELLVDDIVLYEAAAAEEARPFPRRVIFTAWFDTGEQGREWPGDFQIVPHKKPQTWDAARSVESSTIGQPWLRVAMRGLRPLGEETRLRFRYRVDGAESAKIVLVNSVSGQAWSAAWKAAAQASWSEAEVVWKTLGGKQADEVRVLLPSRSVLLVDGLLLYEP